uniref:NADH dehydrogenase [ubiquinone] 1 alpha subcomplex subunit 3 n=1 Tax=Felis catus TaxID=9685 RepID=A0ABI7YIS9_FELCA
MARRLAAFLKDAWVKVLVASFTTGGLGIILPTIRPFTKYATMINQATPNNYPVERGRHRIRSNLQGLSCQHRARRGAGTHKS